MKKYKIYENNEWLTTMAASSIKEARDKFLKQYPYYKDKEKFKNLSVGELTSFSSVGFDLKTIKYLL